MILVFVGNSLWMLLEDDLTCSSKDLGGHDFIFAVYMTKKRHYTPCAIVT